MSDLEMILPWRTAEEKSRHHSAESKQQNLSKNGFPCGVPRVHTVSILTWPLKCAQLYANAPPLGSRATASPHSFSHCFCLFGLNFIKHTH